MRGLRGTTRLVTRTGSRWAAIAILALVLVSGVGASRPAAAATDNDLVAFGQELAGLLRAGEYEAIVDRMEPQEVTCPLYTPGGLQPICEGIPDGNRVSGYLTGVFGSDAGAITRPQVEPVIERLVRDEFESADFRLYTITRNGRSDGFLACAPCAGAVIISTPMDAHAATPIGPSARALEFQVVEQSGQLRIYSFAFGGADAGMLNGGTGEDGRVYIRREPTPPTVGMGNAHRGSSTVVPALAIALGGLLLAVAVAAALADSAGASHSGSSRPG